MSIRQTFSRTGIGAALVCAFALAQPAQAGLLGGGGAVGGVGGAVGGSMGALGAGQVTGGAGGAASGSAITRHVDVNGAAAAAGRAHGSVSAPLPTQRLIDATDKAAARRAQITGAAQGTAAATVGSALSAGAEPAAAAQAGGAATAEAAQGAAASAGDSLRDRVDGARERAAATQVQGSTQAGAEAQAGRSGGAASGGGSAEAGSGRTSVGIVGSTDGSVRR